METRKEEGRGKGGTREGCERQEDVLKETSDVLNNCSLEGSVVEMNSDSF